MQAELLFDQADVDFGGQNQIVNEQEQNREVNPGGLTQTDSEESLNGPKTEEPEMNEKKGVTEKNAEAEVDGETTGVEPPAKKLIETVV